MDNQLPLRDIHLPDPNSWWPPAPGWWLLLLLLMAVAAFFWWLRVKYQQRAVLRAAERELKKIHNLYKSEQNSQRVLAELSELVRRVMISHYHREDVSALVGDMWLARLDQELANHDFTEGAGAVLARGPYQPQVDFDAVQLIALVKRLIKKVLTPQWFGEWSRGWAWVTNLLPRLKIMVGSWRVK
jgi:Tfp pilus assembly protein PilO